MCKCSDKLIVKCYMFYLSQSKPIAVKFDYILHVTCKMLHIPRNMLQVMCYMLYVTYYMLHVTYTM